MGVYLHEYPYKTCSMKLYILNIIKHIHLKDRSCLSGILGMRVRQMGSALLLVHAWYLLPRRRRTVYRIFSNRSPDDGHLFFQFLHHHRIARYWSLVPILVCILTQFVSLE